MDLLVTERLLLRQWAEADLPAFFDIYSRDEVTRWLGPQPRRSVAGLPEARRGLERWRAFSAGLPFRESDCTVPSPGWTARSLATPDLTPTAIRLSAQRPPR